MSITVNHFAIVVTSVFVASTLPGVHRRRSLAEQLSMETRSVDRGDWIMRNNPGHVERNGVSEQKDSRELIQ